MYRCTESFVVAPLGAAVRPLDGYTAARVACCAISEMSHTPSEVVSSGAALCHVLGGLLLRCRIAALSRFQTPPKTASYEVLAPRTPWMRVANCFLLCESWNCGKMVNSKSLPIILSPRLPMRQAATLEQRGPPPSAPEDAVKPRYGGSGFESRDGRHPKQQ